jgi:hypothetical protein
VPISAETLALKTASDDMERKEDFYEYIDVSVQISNGAKSHLQLLARRARTGKTRDEI